MYDIKYDELLIEIKQPHAPLLHNLNSQSVDDGTYLQSRILAMHLMASL